MPSSQVRTAPSHRTPLARSAALSTTHAKYKLAEHSISEVRRSNEKGSHANVGFGFGARKSFESHGADTHSTTSTNQRSHRSKVRLWQGVIEYTLRSEERGVGKEG